MLARNNRKYQPEELFEAVADAIISIKTKESSGSGVLIDSSGVLATNKHVVGNWRKVAVGFKNKSYVAGKVIRSYLDTDLAFVKVDISDFPMASSLPFAFYRDNKAFAVTNSRAVRVGESVFAIGHPLGLDYTFTQGIVSSIQRVIDGQEYLQIDASINPGNSGGGLYNAYGELIGINTMGYAETQGLNFAIPATLIREKYDKLLDEINRGFLNYCSVCGFSSKDNQYCENCGIILRVKDNDEEVDEILQMMSKNDIKVNEASLMSLVKCSVCSAEHSRTEKYCEKCGSEL